MTYPRAFLGGSDSHFAGKDEARRIYWSRNPILWHTGPAGLCKFEIKSFILCPSAGRRKQMVHLILTQPGVHHFSRSPVHFMLMFTWLNLSFNDTWSRCDCKTWHYFRIARPPFWRKHVRSGILMMNEGRKGRERVQPRPLPNSRQEAWMRHRGGAWEELVTMTSS